MEIKDETYNKILINTKGAKDIVGKLNLSSSFWECFHFRPTSRGITIVSTLPYAPMRGIDVSLEKLESAVSDILEKLHIFKNLDAEKGQAELSKIGFKCRSLSNSREENIQALFINGMIANKPQYLGIKFIASELTLEISNRFDVVGYKGNTLYLFELKRKRTSYAAKQVSEYAEFVNNNIERFREILYNYPKLGITEFTDVKPIAVMEYSDNMSMSLTNDAKKIGVDAWFFTENMMFVRS